MKYIKTFEEVTYDQAVSSGILKHSKKLLMIKLYHQVK